MTRSQPWRATTYAFAQVLLGVPLAILFALTTASTALLIVGLGVLGLRVLIPQVTSVARVYGRLAQSMLGRQVPVDLPERTAGLPARQQLSRWAGGRSLWRLAGWLLYAASLGLLLSALVVGLPFGAIALVVLTVVRLVSEPGRSPDLVLLFPVAAGACVLLWWFLADDALRFRCRLDALILAPDPHAVLSQRVADLTESRADTVDHSAAELRRIERDLHDGAQARLVALGMNLGLAADLLERDPAAAKRLLDEARTSTGAALGELRTVVRGIHPPVLADRGLVGAVQALALDLALPVTVDAALPQRPPAPVESAVYFVVAECLANVSKHSGAREAWVVIAAPGDTLLVKVGDNGHGGADPARGSGLRGMVRRLAAFDGTMVVSSPVGGPTVVTVEVPCTWSSPRTTPSSAMG